MSTRDLLILLLVVLGSAIAGVLITVGVSSLVQAHRDRLEPTLSQARSTIVGALSGETETASGILSGLSGFSRRCVIEMMLDLAPSLSGTSRLALVSLADEAGVLGRARAGVRSRRWSTRLYSARVLTAFGVESDDLCSLLSDRSSEVRAQAAYWTVVTPHEQAIIAVIGLLGDEDGLCRFAAQDALIRIGLPGVEALIGALDGPDEEITNRILEIAAVMADDRFYLPAVARMADPSPDTRAVAASVMARTGNPGAGPRLVTLLGDPSDQVVLAAATGLATLAYWPGAAAVEPLLAHPLWEVRKQAALTLLALGASGSILLTVNAPGEGPAAEMAGQALQLRTLAVQSGAA
jgi:HEAT repeat protein